MLNATCFVNSSQLKMPSSRKLIILSFFDLITCANNGMKNLSFEFISKGCFCEGNSFELKAENI